MGGLVLVAPSEVALFLPSLSVYHALIPRLPGFSQLAIDRIRTK
jgi:hypothetical protein